MRDINIKYIEQAHTRIKPYIHKTPILTSRQFDSITGTRLYFKCENFQKVGAFKARGATNAVLCLTEEERSRGVCTHSSGNHAQALAYASGLKRIEAYIVMPDNAPLVKKKAVIDYGANVVECAPTLEARESTVDKIIEEKGCMLIHPYNDHRIIAGQATASKEVFEELGSNYLDYLLTPIGGGGLISGSLLSAKYLSPSTKVIGCEPEGADDAYRSFQQGKHLQSIGPNTIADGLLTTVGEIAHGIIAKNIANIYTVSDAEIIRAMKLTWERMKVLIEPSSAVCLAVVLKNPQVFNSKKIGIILSGGNVDIRMMASLL